MRIRTKIEVWNEDARLSLQEIWLLLIKEHGWLEKKVEVKHLDQNSTRHVSVRTRSHEMVTRYQFQGMDVETWCVRQKVSGSQILRYVLY